MDNVKKIEYFLDRMKGLLENTFPELKESEGERIRYALISQFNDYQRRGENHGFGYSNEEILAWLEKQGEQKLTNKIVFKFHEDDWCIDNEDGTIFQIVKVLDNSYTYKTNEGKEYSCTHYSLENDARLWTIEDAKPGDVLVNGSNIFIFHFINDTRLMGYCHVNTDDGRFYDDIGRNECFCLIDAVVNPATKEQREQLEKAMADAGYTFDFNKKELKKIEQKLSENVKPQSSTPMSYGKELEERMYEACNRFNAPNTDPNRYSAADLFYAGVKAERDLNTHAWSEEDGKMTERLLGWLDTLVTYIHHDVIVCLDIRRERMQQVDRLKTWLKSTKERYNWKPSDEEKKPMTALGK